MNVFAKDPSAVVEFSHDWGESYLRSGEALTVSSWSVDPAGLTVDSSSYTASLASVTLSGGSPGKLYRVSNAVTTTDGRVEERAIAIRVQQR